MIVEMMMLVYLDYCYLHCYLYTVTVDVLLRYTCFRDMLTVLMDKYLS